MQLHLTTLHSTSSKICIYAVNPNYYLSYFLFLSVSFCFLFGRMNITSLCSVTRFQINCACDNKTLEILKLALLKICLLGEQCQLFGYKVMYLYILINQHVFLLLRFCSRVTLTPQSLSPSLETHCAAAAAAQDSVLTAANTSLHRNSCGIALMPVTSPVVVIGREQSANLGRHSVILQQKTLTGGCGKRSCRVGEGLGKHWRKVDGLEWKI